MIIRRDAYLNQLVSKDGNGLVKIVTGVRRCGKSFLLGTIFKDHLLSQGVPASNIVELSFDRFSSKKYRDADTFYAWVQERLAVPGKRYVLLDEVQLLQSFEEILIDLMSMRDVEVYVTGSNAKLLSRDVVTEFRGRGDEIPVRPLSFAEFMGCYQGDAASGYEEYSVYGGMPAVTALGSGEDKARYLESLFKEIYINDIVERNGLRNVDELEAVLDVVSSGIGSLTNPKRISDTFKTAGAGKGPSDAAVRSYIECLKDSFILEEAKRYDVKGREYIGSPFKYYFSDLGLRNARMNFRQVEPTHTMENIVYNELRSRGFGVDVGVVTTHGKNASGANVRKSHEVDFVCNRGSRRYYIQAAYALPTPEKVEQEQASLVNIGDSFKKIVVVRDPVVKRYNDDGILTLGVCEFLLDPTAIDY
jgi:hypothetical protein